MTEFNETDFRFLRAVERHPDYSKLQKYLEDDSRDIGYEKIGRYTVGYIEDDNETLILGVLDDETFQDAKEYDQKIIRNNFRALGHSEPRWDKLLEKQR